MIVAEVLPRQFACQDALAYLAHHVYAWHQIVVGYPLVVEHHIRHLPLCHQISEIGTYEMHYHDVCRPIVLPYVTHHTLYASHLLHGREPVRLIVYHSLEEEQVHRPLREHIIHQSEGMGSRPHGRDACFNETELRLRKALRQVVHQHVVPSLHLRDGTAQESHRSLAALFKL